MNPIFAAALEVQAFCRANGWRFCFIGALAVQRWGEPRLTQDVDLTIITGFGGEGTFVDALLGRFGAGCPMLERSPCGPACCSCRVNWAFPSTPRSAPCPSKSAQ